MKAKLTPQDSQSFILAGKAIVTFKSIKTGKHFTYRITKKKDQDIWFVGVMYSYENQAFNYLGCIKAGKFIHTKASKITKDSPSLIAFNWAWNHLSSNQIEIWHEGRCGRCGKLLTEPESIASGFGPTCRSLIN